MATTFEGCGEELVHNLASHIVVDESTWHNQYVGIVVLTDEMCNLWYPAQSCAHLLVLVQCDSDTLATTADSDTRINLTTLDTLGQSMTKVGIIYTRITPCTIVFYGVTLLLKVLENKLFQSEACVIASHSNCLYFHRRKIFKGTDLKSVPC